MDYLYSYVVDAYKRFPPRVAVHRVLTSTDKVVYVDQSITGFWTPESDTIVHIARRRPTIKSLSRLPLDSQGYASDGVRTYYTMPNAVQAIIRHDAGAVLVQTTKRRGK